MILPDWYTTVMATVKVRLTYKLHSRITSSLHYNNDLLNFPRSGNLLTPKQRLDLLRIFRINTLLNSNCVYLLLDELDVRKATIIYEFIEDISIWRFHHSQSSMVLKLEKAAKKIAMQSNLELLSKVD